MLFCPRLVMKRGSLAKGVRIEEGKRSMSEAAVKTLGAVDPCYGDKGEVALSSWSLGPTMT